MAGSAETVISDRRRRLAARWTRRHGPWLVAIVLGGQGVLPVAAAESAIQPRNLPTPIPGAVNGDLPAVDLVHVAPNCRAARAAAPSLGLLLAEARDRGVELGTEQCYRPLGDQVSVRRSWTTAGNSACAAPVLTTPTGHPKGTSMHGWGKAVDFSDGTGSVTFGSAGYAFLKTYAAAVGWNHPGWAEPGGSACPEAWHWEWVGDGGMLHAAPIRADAVALLPSATGRGYASISGLGDVGARGDFLPHGSVAPGRLRWLVTAAAVTPSERGYWLVTASGQVFGYGDAATLRSPVAGDLRGVVGMAPSPDGHGCWLVTANGGVFQFGNARFDGAPKRGVLTSSVVGIAATPDGGGYWLATADGHVLSFGDARSYGSAANLALRAPVVGIARTGDGKGYWLVGADGGVFSFGDARFYGAASAGTTASPVVGITPTPSGKGYWIIAADGQVRAFGAADRLRTA